MLDHHDAIVLSIVEAAQNARLEYAIDVLELVRVPSIGDVAGVIDNDKIGAIAGNFAMDRNGAKFAAGRGLEIAVAIMPLSDPGRVELLKQWATQNHTNLSGDVMGKVLGVADDEDLGSWRVRQFIYSQRDREGESLEVSRRQIDDEAPQLPPAKARGGET